jgi:hypothetical protein
MAVGLVLLAVDATLTLIAMRLFRRSRLILD